MSNKIVQKIINAPAKLPNKLRKAQAAQSRAGLQNAYAKAHNKSVSGRREQVGRVAYAGRLAKEYALFGALSSRVVGAVAVTSLLDHVAGTTDYSSQSHPGLLGDVNSGIPKLGERVASFLGFHAGYLAATISSLRAPKNVASAGQAKGVLSRTKRNIVALVAADTAAQMVRPLLVAPIYALQATVLLAKFGIAAIGATLGLIAGLPFLLQALLFGPNPMPKETPFAEQMMGAVFGSTSFSPKSLDDFDPKFQASGESHTGNVARYMIKRTGWQAGDKLGLLVDATERWTVGADTNLGASETRIIRRRALRMIGVKATSSFVEPCLFGSYGLVAAVHFSKQVFSSLAGILFGLNPPNPVATSMRMRPMPGAFEA